jgi:phthiocerol/phenolphthiocerol synthesis type-I polyketide synthase E
MIGEFHHQRLNSRPDGSRDKSNPENYTEVRLARIWEEVLGIESIGHDQNYFDLGGDSSLTVQLFARIEDVFKVKLPLPMLFDAPTIVELARNLDREISESAYSSLVPIQPSGSRAPLFCIHATSGNVSIYQHLSRHLGSDQPVYGLQAQGFDSIRPVLTKIEDMAALYIREIRKVRPKGPYLLAGYGMGGTIAFEMAQRLHADGENVALLALINTMNWFRVVAPSVWEQKYYAGQRIAFRAGSFLCLDFKSKINALVRKRVGKKQNNAAKTAVASSASVQTQVWESNDLACSAYVPKFYPGTIIDFRPMRQYRLYAKPELKWNNLAQSVDEVVLPVYPDDMLSEPFVKCLAATLKESLELAVRGPDTYEAAHKAVEVA